MVRYRLGFRPPCKTRDRLYKLEKSAYSTGGHQEEIKRLKRVQRALLRDLDKLVRTIPAPLQFGLPGFTEGDAPREAAAQLGQLPLQEDRGDDPLPQSAEERWTRQGKV
jgi:hypothetical protein